MKTPLDATTTIKTDHEIFENSIFNANYEDKVRVLQLDKNQMQAYLNAGIYLKSSVFILVLNGSMQLEVNFKEYAAEKNAIVLLSFGHFFKIGQLSENFACSLLYVGKDYMEEMYSTDMIYKRVKYGVKMHRKPVLDLNHENARLLEKRLAFIGENILLHSHRYYKEMILNSLLIFFLDLSNIIEQEAASTQQHNLSRDEVYFQKFLKVLVAHYQQEHVVDFYARTLHITPHYLTLIVKRLSGQTVSDFIAQLLFSEAKVLLQQPEASIQQIAERLHFSDQSAFGKFFKRKSGVSPKEFRKQAANS